MIKKCIEFNEALGTKELSKIKKGDKVIYKGKTNKNFIKGDSYKVKHTKSDSEFQPSVVLINDNGETLTTNLIDK